MNGLTSYAKRASEQKGIRTAIFGEPTNNVFLQTEDGVCETYTLAEALEITANAPRLTLEDLFNLKGDFPASWGNYVENEGAEIYLIDDEPNLLGSVNPFSTIQQLKTV